MDDADQRKNIDFHNLFIIKGWDLNDLTEMLEEEFNLPVQQIECKREFF